MPNAQRTPVTPADRSPAASHHQRLPNALVEADAGCYESIVAEDRLVRHHLSRGGPVVLEVALKSR
jgi:hypothetical protein